LRDYPKEILVSVSSEGAYAVNSVPLAGGSTELLASALVAATKAGKDTVVVINADASAKHQSVITVMEASRRAGLAQITFATQPTGKAATR
jgi:biopolymer transport protein ExbD